MRLDAHQHFWDIGRGDYGWLTPDAGPIYRNYHPDDLKPHLDRHDIAGTILVQAAPTVAETEYMLALADGHDFIKGVVGWVDFEAASAADEIARLAEHPGLVGLRPMIQDIADPDWMLKPELAPAYRAMVSHDLVFDALTLPKHLKNLRLLAERISDLRIVIDHGSKPEIALGLFDDWSEDMTVLAAETPAFCKLSGLVTEAGEQWTSDQLRAYVDHMLEIFGPDRLIWGSDWPVCTLASSYDDWVDATEELLKGLSDTERQAILGGNAARVYLSHSNKTHTA